MIACHKAISTLEACQDANRPDSTAILSHCSHGESGTNAQGGQPKDACLGQEHLAGAEEVADDVHAVHEGSFDDLQRRRVLAARPRLLGILRLSTEPGSGLGFSIQPIDGSSSSPSLLHAEVRKPMHIGVLVAEHPHSG